MRRSGGTPRRFDGLDGRVRGRRGRNRRGRCRRRRARCGLRSRAAARHIARVARAQLPRPVRVTVAPGVTRRAAGAAARSRRLLRAGRPLSAALVAPDDGHPGAGGGRAGDRRRLPAAGRGGAGRRRRGRASRGCSASAARTPSRRSPTERRRCPRVDKIVGPGNKYVAAAKSYVARDCAIDFQAGPERDPDPVG